MKVQRQNEPAGLSGTILFEDGSQLDFEELISLVFVLKEGAEAIPQNVSEWPIQFDPNSISRSVPLSWVKSIEVLAYETRGYYRCLFDPVVAIENVNGASIRAEYATLEWVKVRTVEESTGELRDRHVYFANSGAYLQALHESRINIRKIIFHH